MTRPISRPVIGITSDVSQLPTGRLRCELGLAYSQSVAAAGGLPVILPPIESEIPSQLALCDGIVFSGGDDINTETFGQPVHPEAKVMHQRRQAYETALFAALNAAPRPTRDIPVLGICLGMQMMSMVNGGKINQHLPDTLPSASEHRDHKHPMALDPAAAQRLGLGKAAVAGPVDSYHHQAITDPGRLQTLATSADGVIEAVVDPDRPFHVGVQWHPERTDSHALGPGLFQALVAQARKFAESRISAKGNADASRP